jgi:hypothetical protein
VCAMDMKTLQGEIKEKRATIGKLHAEACSHRLNKDPESVRKVHFKIDWCEREIKEIEYLIKWVGDHGELT